MSRVLSHNFICKYYKFRILENIFANMGVLDRALVRAFVKEYYHIKYN